jgi:hypothetical protein
MQFEKSGPRRPDWTRNSREQGTGRHFPIGSAGRQSVARRDFSR